MEYHIRVRDHRGLYIERSVKNCLTRRTRYHSHNVMTDPSLKGRHKYYFEPLRGCRKLHWL